MLNPSDHKEERSMQNWRLNEQTTRKYEAAERLRLLPRLLECGWPGLSAKDAGRIGGSMRAHAGKAACEDRS